MSKKKDYLIGYKRPPRHSQWKPGESGNDRGRRRKVPTLPDLIEEEFNRNHVLNVAGQHEKLSGKRVLIRCLFKAAYKGNVKLLLFLMECLKDIQSARMSAVEEHHSLRPSKEDISKMSSEELTELYMKAVRESRDEGEPDGDRDAERLRKLMKRK